MINKYLKYKNKYILQKGSAEQESRVEHKKILEELIQYLSSDLNSNKKITNMIYHENVDKGTIYHSVDFWVSNDRQKIVTIQAFVNESGKTFDLSLIKDGKFTEIKNISKENIIKTLLELVE
jgi:hypothetical protein